MINLNEIEANWVTIYNLHLTKRDIGVELKEIVRDLIGIHASRYRSPIISIICRSRSRTIESNFQELYHGDDFYRIRCMRGTLHILNTIDAIICHKATLIQRLRTCCYLAKQLSLNETLYYLLSNRIIESIEIKPKNAEELAHDIYRKQRNISTYERKVLKIVLRILWEKGILLRQNRSTEWETESNIYMKNSNRLWFELLSEISVQEAEEALIKRYFRSYGPATLEDASWWSGLSMTRIRDIVSRNYGEINEVSLDNSNQTYYVSFQTLNNSLREHQDRYVCLLAYEDNLLKGYKFSRKRFVKANYMSKVYNASGESNASILVNGKVRGIWKYYRNDKTIGVNIFENLSKSDMDLLMQELKNIQQVLDSEVRFMSF